MPPYQDSITALMGAPTTSDEERMAMSLRNDRTAGNLLGLSTIDQVSNLGTGMTKNTMIAAKQAGALKQAKEKMLSDQLRIKEAEDARITAANVANDRRIEAAALVQEGREDAKVLALANRREDKEEAENYKRIMAGVLPNGAQMRVEDPSPEQAVLYDRYDKLVGKNKTPFSKMPSDTAVKEFEDSFNQSKVLFDVMKTYKPEYANMREIPWGGSLLEFASSKTNILTNEQQEEAAAWWANFNRQFTLGARNALFGGALTEGESAAWDQANLTSNMNEKQIKMFMDNMYETAVKKGERNVQLGATKGYPEQWMLQNMNGVLNDPLGFNIAENNITVAPNGEPLPEGIIFKNGKYFNSSTGEEVVYNAVEETEEIITKLPQANNRTFSGRGLR
tara:strand:+ start:538 stop:1716 length:1179 start_codon:yes stop_codon:yes gene_type:complete